MVGQLIILCDRTEKLISIYANKSILHRQE